MAKYPKILLIIETSRIYGRKLLRGVAQYALLNGPWQIERQAPFYLQHSQEVGDFSLKNAAGFDGIIMREQKNIEPLIETGIPIVFASYLKKDLNAPMIRTDDEGIATAVAKHYLERGFENFAFAGYDGMFWSDSRKTAFAGCIKDAGYECQTYVQPKSKKHRDWKQGIGLLSDWLQKIPKPVALMACNDDRAQQVLTACQQAELHVPEDVAIVGVDNDEFVCTLANPPLSSVNLSTEIAGFEAASVLDRMIQGEKIKNIVIPVQVSNIITRQSSDILAVKDPLVAQSINFIRNHIREPIQIEDVLNVVPVSRRNLHEKFKKTMGVSIHQYVKKLRIEYIENLLLNTEMSISKIAYHMGLKSDEHIATYFRSVKGINPHAFRTSRKLK